MSGFESVDVRRSNQRDVSHSMLAFIDADTYIHCFVTWKLDKVKAINELDYCIVV